MSDKLKRTSSNKLKRTSSNKLERTSSNKLERTSSNKLRNSIIRNADTGAQAFAVSAATTGALGIIPVSTGTALVSALLAAISHTIKGKSEEDKKDLKIISESSEKLVEELVESIHRELMQKYEDDKLLEQKIMEVIYESTKSFCHEKSFINKLKEQLEEKSKTLVRPSGFMTSTRGIKRVIKDKTNSKDSPVVESPSPPSRNRGNDNRRGSKGSRRGNKNKTEPFMNPMHKQDGGYRKKHKEKRKKTIKKTIKRKQKKTKRKTKRRARHKT